MMGHFSSYPLWQCRADAQSSAYSSDTLISGICEETYGLSKHTHDFHQQIILQQDSVVLFLHAMTLLE